MLFLIFGSSCSGKTAALAALMGQDIPRLGIHDFDEIGVPSDADGSWRHQATALWIDRAKRMESRGTDLLLAGQTPFGELLASTATPNLQAVSSCLFDCTDEVRLQRLRERGTEWLQRSGTTLEDYLAWAAWLRGHAADPTWEQDVIQRADRRGSLSWKRWTSWQPDDPRWRVTCLDTTSVTPEAAAAALESWVDTERRLVVAGEHPLARRRRWWETVS